MLPSRSDGRWRSLLENPDRYAYEFLALRIMMQRVSRTPSTERAPLLDEVHALFTKYERLMGKDIAAIFG